MTEFPGHSMGTWQQRLPIRHMRAAENLCKVWKHFLGYIICTKLSVRALVESSCFSKCIWTGFSPPLCSCCSRRCTAIKQAAVRYAPPPILSSSWQGTGNSWYLPGPTLATPLSSTAAGHLHIFAIFQDWCQICNKGRRLWTLRGHLCQKLFQADEGRKWHKVTNQVDGAREPTRWHFYRKDRCGRKQIWHTCNRTL